MYNNKIFLLLLTLFSISKPLISKEKIKPRRSGILMHITSLPSKYGIGTLGKESYNFINFLIKAKQKEWQLLPIGPTGYRGSPYDTFSSFAGNHYLIDFDILIKENLLFENEVSCENWGSSLRYVDFTQLYVCKDKVLKKAFERFKQNEFYLDFCNKNNFWLDDYSLYMSLKKFFNEKPWFKWPKEIKFRNLDTIKKYKNELKNEIEYQKFIQFKFYEQFNKLRNYAHSNGISLIGDIGIYVPYDSVDTWVNPHYFQFDNDYNPLFVSGVPPDAFNPKGQLWGNPLYNWDKMKENKFSWFIMRLKSLSEKFDTIRIDHFRGLESYWSIPYGEKNTNKGKWVKGPGKDLIDIIHKELPNVNFIAEDLGYLTNEVIELRKYSGFPGMKLLQFAFDSRELSNKKYLPHNYPKNSVCYIGTHDNNIIQSWQEELKPIDRLLVEKYLNLEHNSDLRIPMLKAGLATISNLFIAQMQDYIGVTFLARMNRPGMTDGNNWVWRARPNEINDTLASQIAEMTILYGRAENDVKVPVLVGDVGGTNSRLKLVLLSSNENDDIDIIDNKKLHSFDFKSVDDLLLNYLNEYIGSSYYPKYVVLGVPGPIKDNTVIKFTNVPHWGKVKGDDIANKLNIEKVIFLNDFVVNGYGIQTKLIKGIDYTIINDVPIDPNGVKITFGPGTGLGMGFLTKNPNDKYYTVNPSEGSHYDFPVRNELQFKYMNYLLKYYNIDHISVERATCGQAIIPIYKFLYNEYKIDKDIDIDLFNRVMKYDGTSNSFEQITLNDEILRKGVNKKCKLCYEVDKFFIELYGAAAGNAAMFTLPNGGIYLLGGISIVLEDLIVNSNIFMKAFIDKGRFKDVLKNIPIFLIKNGDLGTKGCVEYARRLLEEKLGNEDYESG